jgi:hypothetical protein
LPRELRDQIYYHAIDSSADIRLSRHDIDHPGLTPVPFTDEPSAQYLVISGHSRLSYKVVLSCTLLLVSKRIHHEVYHVLRVLQNKLQSLIAEILNWSFGKSPRPKLVKHCPSLCFVFDSTRSWCAIALFSKLQEPLKPCVRSIVFAKGCLGRQQGMNSGWQPESERGPSWLCVLRSLPGLKTLGVEVKINNSQLQPSTLAALRVGTELLQKRKINALYLLYRTQRVGELERTGHGGPIRLALAPTAVQHQETSSQLSPQIQVDEVIQDFVVEDVRPWTLKGNQPWLSDERSGGYRQHIERLVQVTRQE